MRVIGVAALLLSYRSMRHSQCEAGYECRDQADANSRSHQLSSFQA
jgi:hypothetical protein